MNNNDTPTDNTANLVKVRDRIDSIDDQVLDLLKERLLCAKEIGRLRKQGVAVTDPVDRALLSDKK